MQLIGLTGRYTAELKEIFLPKQEGEAKQVAIDRGLDANVMVIRILSTQRLQGDFPTKTDRYQDANNLRKLADWFDTPTVQERFAEWHDSNGGERSNEVQQALRRIATVLEHEN